MTTVAAVSALAQDWVMVQPGDWDPASGHGPEWGKAAPAGLLIWLFMGVALFLLIKSMNRHLRRVPKTFDTDGDESGDAVESTIAGADGESRTGPDANITQGDAHLGASGEPRADSTVEESVAATPPQSKDAR